MISIFNSTTDYKGFVATNCEKIRKNDGKGIQELRRLHSAPLDRGCISRRNILAAKNAKKWKAVGEPGCVSPRENNAASVVTLCSKCAYPTDEAENLLWM